METVRQWNILANDVAGRIDDELMRRKLYTATVHVRHSCGIPNNCGSSAISPFDEGFYDLLTSQLVSFGIQTLVTPERADFQVEYKVQAVYHPSEPPFWDWPKPGVLTALTAGIVVFRNVPWEWAAGAGAVDMLRANDRNNGRYEVIITTSIVRGNQYIMRFSDMYTIPNGDFWQYRHPSPAPAIRLTGPAEIQSTSSPQTTTSL